jgi:hypothetical protein
MNRTYDIRNTKMYADEQGKLKSDRFMYLFMNIKKLYKLVSDPIVCYWTITYV